MERRWVILGGDPKRIWRKVVGNSGRSLKNSLAGAAAAMAMKREARMVVGFI